MRPSEEEGNRCTAARNAKGRRAHLQAGVSSMNGRRTTGENTAVKGVVMGCDRVDDAGY